MIQHVWSVLCQSSSIDQLENTVSLFNVLEEITVTGPQAPDEGTLLPINMNIVSLWTKDNKDEKARGKMRACLTGPGNRQYESIELDIDLSQSVFYRGRIFAQVLKWNGVGKYTFLIEFKENDGDDWRMVTALPVWMNINIPQSTT